MTIVSSSVASMQSQELDYLETTRLEEEGRKMAAKRQKEEREAKEKLSALDVLDSLMDSQRRLQEENEEYSSRNERLKKEHEQARVSVM